LKFILPEGPVIRNITLPVRQTCGSHQLFPLAYVANGAIIDVKFAEFDGPLPLGFEPILIERAII
jgi:hypothetical protein